MSIVNLHDRFTTNEKEFEDYKKSPDSKIYVSKKPEGLNEFAMNLHLSNRYWETKRKIYREVPKNGLKVKPLQSILVEADYLMIPDNVFGEITGRGMNTYKHIQVASGKIDPGFNDVVLISLFNAGRTTVKFKTGGVLACCFFHNTESLSQTSFRKLKLEERVSPLPSYSIFTKWGYFISDNWKCLIPIGISILTLLHTVL